MQLLSLSVSGFKSFGNQTTVEFSPGVTAIVGPNGCGKSNLVDAIRWVLGEQRSSVLRGERMENVIFNGTVSRKPLSFSEAKLTIDNSAGRLQVPYAEVEIARRLHRDGTSEYLLNSNPCRLRDVTDMLHDSGMGPNLYTILELKMVEEILREDGEGRRMLFEEAAGVAKYKIRRRQAQQKLRLTEDDLLRLADIITEVERLVSSLRRQVARAKRYQGLLSELRLKEAALSYRRYCQLRDDIEPLQRSMARTSADTESASVYLRTEELKLENLRVKALDKEKGLTVLRDQLTSVVEEIARYSAEDSGLRARDKAARERIERARMDKILLNEKRETLKGRWDEAVRTSEAYGVELSDADRVFAAANDSVLRNRTKSAEIEGELRTRTEAVNALRQLLGQKTSEFSSKTAARATLLGKREARLHEAETAAKERESAASSLEQLRSNQLDMQKLLDKLRATAAAQTLNKDRLAGDIARAEASLSKVISAIHAAHSKLDLLSTLEEKGPRASKALRALKEQAVPGLIELLGDAVEVDERFRPALQAVLGPAAYFYMAESVKSALDGSAVLQREEAGRATFVCTGDLEASDVHSQELPAGAVGHALDLLNRQAENSALRHFLGRVVLMQDWQSAVNAFGWANTQRCILVSLDGQWLSGEGIVHAGSEEYHDIVDLGLRHQVEDLRAVLLTLESEKRETDEKLSLTREQLRLTESDCSILEQDIAQKEEKVRELREREIHYETLVNVLEGRRREALAQIAELDNESAVLEEELITCTREIASQQGMLSEAEADVAEIAKRVSAAQVRVDEAIRSLHEAERARDAVLHRVDMVKTELNRIDKNQHEIDEGLVVIEQNGESAAEEIRETEQRRNVIERLLSERYVTRDGLQHSLDVGNVELDSSREAVREQEDRLKTARQSRDSVLEGERRIATEVARLEGEMDSLLSGSRQQFGMDMATEAFTAAFPGLSDVDTSHEVVHELRDKMEKLGPVNTLAVDEYEQENFRLETMLRQREDLLSAKKTLEETVARINETAQAMFLHVFESVRLHFQRLFVEFFPAGEADLILSGQDLLDADITLWANPSGKRLRSISLMSGGEKTMTAIALLFALYQVKPSPFCILDEVDAPLDDMNIDRFTRMIRHHSDQTQFILVTHNKRTMEVADNLYGVTMEEEGVSKLVSVRLLSAVA